MERLSFGLRTIAVVLMNSDNDKTCFQCVHVGNSDHRNTTHQREIHIPGYGYTSVVKKLLLLVMVQAAARWRPTLCHLKATPIVHHRQLCQQIGKEGAAVRWNQVRWASTQSLQSHNWGKQRHHSEQTVLNESITHFIGCRPLGPTYSNGFCQIPMVAAGIPLKSDWRTGLVKEWLVASSVMIRQGFRLSITLRLLF